MIYSEDAPKLENELHNEFVHRRINKINLRKEFFRVQLADVRHLLESKEVSVHWTMLAEAREYRETLAIEHDSHLKANPERKAPAVVKGSRVLNMQETPN